MFSGSLKSNRGKVTKYVAGPSQCHFFYAQIAILPADNDVISFVQILWLCQKSSARLLNQKRGYIAVGYPLEGSDEYGVEVTVSGACSLSVFLVLVWASFPV